ncbi:MULTISPECIES: alpha-amylase family glycosyl hydrolase [unclassified Tolypothrix]|uniref:alpha-amylase family glycosyl hydrolase n=1 Tax=unclassified Tolypothrix TaxID=2649714 RepID=UPI0005EABD73|nr:MULTISPECIES: alpha-amylase family glycosyl hydrolase [unclassified Tolypothrix]BAY89895.1 alpha amylase catalytic region [Microchaete diplosiphon NIES-3275]EKE96934.1 alpha amylase, catalytic domain protein [Tolypothrix sp. PCC 7601]MBE9082163.1 alpha amylase C-terminal domain-containing protein [Tolypothrix sp. LEGE 11397]UYD24132.1 alpha amylase C-terminal domain-containing protein [Tolypothrix sp. PCC 7712]UYD33636.1 alpha amylase C-terminal domain-containing protein [Tolypothrix sp. PC
MSAVIEFKLFAPRNNQASLIGSFSDWQEMPMKKGEDGYFYTQLNLEDGIYQYKFRVQTKSPNFSPDEWVEVIDPYATDVDEQQKVGIVQIKDGKPIVDTYIWQHDDIPLPENQELVIYEMHVADFTGGEVDSDKRGKYLNAIEKLDYLRDLGINAVELMPVNEYPGDYSWGYKVRHFFATESSYGSTADLKLFIDECHSRGIRVFMDGIYNHTDEECPLMLIDRNYWYYEYMHYPEDPDNYWGPEFNYDNYNEKLDVKPAWKYVGDVVRFWVQEYHIDGIRFDAVRQLANFEFLHWLAQQAKKNTAPKPFYNIAEHIPDTSKVTTPEGPLDACWHESFHYFIVPHVCSEKFELDHLKQVLDPKQQGYKTGRNVINYLSTHDRDRLFRELGNRGIFGEAAFTRAKLAAALLMTAKGIPMLWMGEEFGEHKKKSESVTQPKKIAWPLLENAENRDLWHYYQQLIALRKHNLALQSDNIEFFYEDADAKLLAYFRWHEQGSQVVVVVNFHEQKLTNYCIPKFPNAENWQDYFSHSEVEVGQDGLVTDLEPYTAKIYVFH